MHTESTSTATLSLVASQRRGRRAVATAIIAMLVWAAISFVVPPLAMAAGTASGATVTEDTSVFAAEPAVEVIETEEEEPAPPWTLRFLVPTVLALAVLGLVVSLVVYAIRVRARYRVVER